MRNRFFRKKIEQLSIKNVCEIGGCKFEYQGKDSNINNKLFNSLVTLKDAKQDDISFFTNDKYIADLKETNAGAIIINEKNKEHVGDNVVKFISDNPYLSYAKLIAFIYSSYEEDKIENGNNIASSAKIGNNVQIGKNNIIEDYVVIGDNAIIGDHNFIKSNAVIGNYCEIGNNNLICENVTIKYSIMGNNNIINPGVCIGQDGFGFASGREGHFKIKQIGQVIMGNHIEIGSNTTIDRGSMGDTIIGDGTKIDNLVQIGHNVKIGRNCLIVSQVGISGSTEIGDFVVLGGQVGVAGHLKIGSFARFAAQSGISKNIPEGMNDYIGSPVRPREDYEFELFATRKMARSFKKDRDSKN